MNLYEQIYHDLKARIASGEFNSGELMPTEAELQEKYGVSRITVKHAYEKLAAEKLIVRIAGKGTVLSESRTPGAHLIGLVLCDMNPAFGVMLVKSIEKTARQHGYSVVLKISGDNHDAESRILAELGELGVKGIIIQNCHGAFTKNLIELSIKDFPLVSVDRYAKGMLIPSVTSDNFNACVNATEYMLKKGCKKLLLASINPQNTSSLTERIDGFKQAHINCGISLSYDNFILDLKSPVTHKKEDIADDIDKITHFLKTKGITGIIATERIVAGLCSEAVSRMGKSFPDDFEMICFDYETEFLSKSKYTYISQNEEKMGRAAAEQLINQISNNSYSMRTVIKTELVFGGSTK